MLDWIFQWWDQLAQTQFVGFMVNDVKWVDWFALLFIGLGVVYGIENGLLAELAEIAQMMTVVFLTFEIYPSVEIFLKNHADLLADESAAGVAYILIGGSIWIATGFLMKFLKGFFHTQLTPSLRIAGGGLLGAFHLFLIFSFIAQAIVLLPLRQVGRVFEPGSSHSGMHVARLAPEIHRILRVPLDALAKKTQDQEP